MRILVLYLILFISSHSLSQKVIPLIDFNGYFKSFQDGFFRQLEFQRIKDFKSGDDVVGYINSRGNLVVYNGLTKMELSNIIVDYRVSDRLLTWKIGKTLNMWDAGRKRTLSYDVGNYWVKDSLIVFQDMRYQSVSAYYNGEIFNLYSSVGGVDAPDFVGENIVAFRDNGGLNKVFWQGTIYELDVWHNPFKYEGGTDILAFNDPTTGTFAIFEKGEFLDVEDFFMDSYKAGRGFIVYENRNGDLMHYSNGVKTQLTNFGASFWEVKDDVVIWSEGGYTYSFNKGEKIELARYIPEDYILKNNVIVFRNIMGGVSALVDGNKYEITNQMNSDYSIHGSSILVELFNNSFIVLSNGKKYTI